MSSTVTKAVIPVAGLGTRVLPASKAIPKEMMPVVDKPVIQYVVEEAISAGITEIILVTRAGKAAIEDHFDTHFELEAELERKNKLDILTSIQYILPAEVTVTTVRQHRALGLGHAVLCAATAVGCSDFAVLLPDMLINNYKQPETDLQGMAKAYQHTGHGQVMVEPVPMEEVHRYGVVNCGEVNLQPGQAANISGMVEKPPAEQAPSNLTINGRYILPARIMELLRNTPPGAGGEIQLTDALQTYLAEGKLQAFHMQGKTFDCGNKAGYVQANLIYGLQHPETRDNLKDCIKNLAL